MSQVLNGYNKYELMFTPHLIPSLAELRGESWQNLVCKVSCLPETHRDVLAFSMMMIDLDGCLTCEMDSYRAQRGCAVCAKQAIISFKGSDDQLVKRFEKAKSGIDEKIDKLPAGLKVYTA